MKLTGGSILIGIGSHENSRAEQKIGEDRLIKGSEEKNKLKGGRSVGELRVLSGSRRVDFQNPIMDEEKDTSVGHVNPHLGKMNGLL